MLVQSQLPKNLWAETLLTTCYIVHLSPSAALEFKTPFEIWHEKPTNYDNLKVFGCPTYAHVSQRKLAPRALKGQFIGYPEGVKGFKPWCINLNPPRCIITSHQIVEDEPKSYKEAIQNSYKNEWKKAIDEEISSLQKNNTWELVKRPGNRRIVGCKWIFRVKDGLTTTEPRRFKARLDMELNQLDVKPAFRHGRLHEEILMTQPEGYIDSKKADYVSLQHVVALSKYTVAIEAIKEALWLKALIVELGIKQETVEVYCDSSSAIYLSKNPGHHEKTKHIDIKLHFIRNVISKGVIRMMKVHTDNNPANMLTKAFGFTSSVKAKRSQMRATEKEQRRLHIPTIDRSYGEPPPYVVVVQEPPRCTKTDICNLTKFISVKKFPSLHWRTGRPYVVIDRFEDVTPPERVHMNNKCDRNITIYGYLRGCNLKKGTKSCNLHGMLVSMTALKDKEANILSSSPLPGKAQDVGEMLILKSVSNSDEDNFAEHVEFNEGQHRRRAIFGYGVDSGDQKDSYEEGEDGDSDEGEDDDNDTVDNQLSSGTEEREDNVLIVALYEDDMENKLMLTKSSLRRCTNLIQLVYRKSASTSETLSKEVHDSSKGEESDDDEFFKPKVKGNKKNQVSKGKSEDDDSDDAVYGDYEDLETCEKHEGQCEDNSGSVGIANEDESAVEEWRLKKLTLQSALMAFDFDLHMMHLNLLSRKCMKKMWQSFIVSSLTKLDWLTRRRLNFAKQMNIAELNDLDEVTRIEGFQTGTYLGMEIHDVPFEMVEYFDPCHPVLVGGIGLGKQNVGYMQARLKQHRWWHKKVLKSRDPIFVSIGWRRIQTVPVYAIEDRNGRHRMLKYTPEHMHSLAMFWGPLAPPQMRSCCPKFIQQSGQHSLVATTSLYFKGMIFVHFM
ncbi:ribosome biogenesis protein bms1 [Citrus sinensis]|nr:ribosome biogenesis protein bms1 [Citrus sinensis]